MTTHLTEFLVFVGASIILVPLFQKMGFGSVLGYLLAGIIVGPFGLELIHNTENVSHISEFGVVFLLFLIGLEIQPQKLISMRKSLLGLGGLQILISSLIFFSLFLVFSFEFKLSLILGFSLSLSSTAFALQYLLEKNMFNSDFGKSSFSVLLAQDLVAIPALAIIPIVLTSETSFAETTTAKLNLPLAAVIFGFIFISSRFLIRPLFRYIASLRARDLFTAMTLFIVVGVAALMEYVGLSAALGAFIAGVLLADSEYRHELEVNLEPFKSLLMGLFFIAVGMKVDLSILFNKPFLLISLALGYLSIKVIVIYCVGKLFKLTDLTSKQMALTIAQGGEFAFVIFTLIAQFNLLKESEADTLSILTIIITLSMALNPLFQFIDEKITQKKLQNKIINKNYDAIENENPKVIIAGFGRFGQIFGRIFKAQGLDFVAIDHDAAQIELVRKFGNKVYYGDASRLDLLESAGAKNAIYFILAVDDQDISINIAQTLVTHFPHLIIFARARNRNHVFELMRLGITHIKRETFDSSLNFVTELLVNMGHDLSKAKTITEKFAVHDQLMIEKQFQVLDDDTSMLSVSQQGVLQLSQVLSEENLSSNIKSS